MLSLRLSVQVYIGDYSRLPGPRALELAETQPDFLQQERQVTSYKLEATSYKRYKLQVSSYKLQVTSNKYKSQATSFKQLATSYRSTGSCSS